MSPRHIFSRPPSSPSSEGKGAKVILDLHCAVYRTRKDLFEGVCLENAVAAVASTPEETIRKLSVAIESYFEDLNDELVAAVEAGRLDTKDEVAIKAAIRSQMRRVSGYYWKLLLWHAAAALQRSRDDRRHRPTGYLPFKDRRVLEVRPG